MTNFNAILENTSVRDRLSEHYHLNEKDLVVLGDIDPDLINAVQRRVRELVDVSRTGSDDDLQRCIDEAGSIQGRLYDIVKLRVEKIVSMVIPTVFGKIKPDTECMLPGERVMFDHLVAVMLDYAKSCHVLDGGDDR